MTGFEPLSSGIGSDCHVNCATTKYLHFLLHVRRGYTKVQLIHPVARV